MGSDPSLVVSAAQAASSAARVAGVHASEHLLFATLVQLVIIVLGGRLGGVLARRLGQSAAVGEIVMGLLLGPSLFGLLAPELFAAVFRSTPPQTLTMLSQIGLLLLMFQIGLEFDFAHLGERRNRHVVWWVAAAGLVAPFGLGLLFAWWLPPAYLTEAPRLAFALFVATAFSITALPILGRILMEFRLSRTPLGVITISAAAINDVVGWLLLAMVTALSTAAFSLRDFAVEVALVLAFGALSWWVIRPPLERFVAWRLGRGEAAAGGGAGPATLDPTLMGVIIAVIFLMGMATFQLGIFAIFGGFMAGVLLHRQRDFALAWQERVGSFVQVFFLPIFFTYTGLRTDVGSLGSASAWGWCALLITLATLGKFGACWLAARVAGLSGPAARLVGILMNTRALMELIIINVGYDLGVIGREVFTMLVLMAVFSTLVTTPLLRRWLPGLRGDAVLAGAP
ncbi:transporter (CPA2 family) [Sphaerotilus hippei]|uniref:Transporter (CPA2 family) n=1 Tax=Sphaerotilus hippei TaxID=744406 RepID=A0A318HC12_9BURK|nr:cation:proton antiporter [Sphaerotilus hippei]PXW96641.1 transporter (CPA2 family) [Sphaerotilus hippei]